MVLSKAITTFLFNLKLPFNLPQDVEVLDVHHYASIKEVCKQFYSKFYNDNICRRLMIGINPGRFGGGVTGIPFTDPIRLEQDCGIQNSFVKKQELSSVFMYQMMQAYGGVERFYRDVYISAISPLGFVKHGKNLNYYDDKELKLAIKPFVENCMNKQLSFGLKRDYCICIGEGENLKYLRQLNEEHGWFDHIRAVAHPRFIMQYKLKQKQHYIGSYLDALRG